MSPLQLTEPPMEPNEIYNLLIEHYSCYHGLFCLPGSLPKISLFPRNTIQKSGFTRIQTETIRATRILTMRDTRIGVEQDFFHGFTPDQFRSIMYKYVQSKTIVYMIEIANSKAQVMPVDWSSR